MLKNKKIILAFLILAFAVSSAYAQTNPYSRYGYGMLKDNAVGASKGMGGISYGLRNSFSANPGNPASYSRVDSLTFLFDVGVTYNRSKLSDSYGSQTDNDGRLDYVTVLMPLSKRLGLSAGLLPFSTVGYEFGSVETNEGVSYIRRFSGTGGLSQLYIGLGYETPLKGLSLGVNAMYLFGSLDYESGMPEVSTTSYYTLSSSTSLSMKTLKFDIGAQYEKQLSKKNLLTVGAVYSPAMNYSDAKYENIESVLGNSSSGSLIPVDQTVTTHGGQNAGLPATYGLGFTLNHDQRLVIGADATLQQWSDIKYSSKMDDGLDASNRFNDRWRYNVGAEYMINPYGRNFIHKIKFRGGLNYSNSYMNAKDKNGAISGYNEYGATLGFGIPLRDNQSFGNRVSYVNLNFEYRKMKPETKGMISEEYIGVSLNVNINELWFWKRKIY